MGRKLLERLAALDELPASVAEELRGIAWLPTMPQPGNVVRPPPCLPPVALHCDCSGGREEGRVDDVSKRLLGCIDSICSALK